VDTIYEQIYAIGQSRSNYLNIIVYFQVLGFVICCHILSVYVYLLSVLHVMLVCMASYMIVSYEHANHAFRVSVHS